MACVAVTRGGFGDIWLFDNRNQAYLHPIVQYGDAILSGPLELLDQYSSLEWNRLRSLIGMPPVPIPGEAPRKLRVFLEGYTEKMWAGILERAVRPPSDPQRVCDIVSQDRRDIVAKKKHDAPAQPASEAPVKAEKGSNLPPVVRGPKDVSQDAVISFGVDKDGKAYSADENNPKKEGSKTRERFKMYREGMTISQALEAGLTTADLVYDRNHGYVNFEGGTTTPASTASTEEDSHENSEDEELLDADA